MNIIHQYSSLLPCKRYYSQEMDTLTILHTFTVNLLYNDVFGVNCLTFHDFKIEKHSFIQIDITQILYICY